MENQHIVQHARLAQTKALCSYSQFPVGACLLSDHDNLSTGFNIESASYGLTMCAERVALYNALSKGYRHHTYMALVTNTGSFPCGACRQVLYEYCPNLTIIIATPTEIITTSTIEALLPHGFGNKDVTILTKGL